MLLSTRLVGPMLLYLLLLPFVFPFEESDSEYWQEIAEKNLQKKLEEYKRVADRPLPKNIILFVGNGQGVSTLTMGMIYKAEKAGKIGKYAEMPLFFDSFSSGIVKTSSLTSHTTSAEAAMMAILTGRKTDDGKIGTLPGKTPCTEGNAIQNESFVDLALKKKELGLVTDVRLSNPTTATLFAKGIDISSESSGNGNCAGKDIVSQLLTGPTSQFKVLIGEEMARDISDKWKTLDGKRNVVTGGDQLKKYKPNGEHLLGIMKKSERSPGQFAEITEKAIKAMETENGDKGYILVVHSGRVEEALNENKARLAAEELLQFEEAVKKAREMTVPEETLVIVTADSAHAVSLPGYLSKSQSLFHETILNPPVDDSAILSKENKKFKIGVVFLVGPGGSRSIQYSQQEGADPNFVSPAMYKGSRSNKAADDVGIFSDGPFAWLFTGAMDNTEIGYRLKHLIRLSVKQSGRDTPPASDKLKEAQEKTNKGVDMKILAYHAVGLVAAAGGITAAFAYTLACQNNFQRVWSANV